MNFGKHYKSSFKHSYRSPFTKYYRSPFLIIPKHKREKGEIKEEEIAKEILELILDIITFAN